MCTQAKLSKKAPFSEYASLEQQGATIVFGDPTDPASLPSDAFDIVYDNNAKELDKCKALIDHAKVRHAELRVCDECPTHGLIPSGRIGKMVWSSGRIGDVYFHER